MKSSRPVLPSEVRANGKSTALAADPEIQRGRLIVGVSLFFALATAVGLSLRLLVAPLATTVVIVDIACIVGFLLATLLARRGESREAGSVTLLFMVLLVLITGYFVGALDAPVMLVTPLIPLTACLLISARAGLLCALSISAALAGFAIAGEMGWPVPESPLSAEGLRIMRAVMLTLTSILAVAVILRYEKIQTQLRSMALHDALTGIANRGSFDQQFLYEFQRGGRNNEPLSLLLIDVDYFKAYNDHYGHQAGDECLIRIADAIARRTRRAGDFFARYGGEEFVVLLPNTSLQEAIQSAEVLVNKIAGLDVEHAGCQRGTLTISVGVACCDDFKTRSRSDVLAAADTALYKAKEYGRNRVEPQPADR